MKYDIRNGKTLKKVAVEIPNQYWANIIGNFLHDNGRTNNLGKHYGVYKSTAFCLEDDNGAYCSVGYFETENFQIISPKKFCKDNDIKIKQYDLVKTEYDDAATSIYYDITDNDYLREDNLSVYFLKGDDKKGIYAFKEAQVFNHWFEPIVEIQESKTEIKDYEKLVFKPTSQEESKAVQELLFKLGYKWRNTNTDLNIYTYNQGKYIFIDIKNKILTHGSREYTKNYVCKIVDSIDELLRELHVLHSDKIQEAIDKEYAALDDSQIVAWKIEQGSEKNSEDIQKFLFDNKYSWASGDAKIRYYHSRYLTIHIENREITHDDSDYFDKEGDCLIVTFEELKEKVILQRYSIKGDHLYDNFENRILDSDEVEKLDNETKKIILSTVE